MLVAIMTRIGELCKTRYSEFWLRQNDFATSRIVHTSKGEFCNTKDVAVFLIQSDLAAEIRFHSFNASYHIVCALCLLNLIKCTQRGVKSVLEGSNCFVFS